MTHRFRLMTANLFAGGADPDALRRILERERPDVLALQEVSPGQARAIEATGLLPHGEMEPRRDTGGLGLLLRHPGSVRRLRLPRRDAWIAEIRDWDGRNAAGAGPPGGPLAAGPLEVINVHITPPHHLPPWRMVSQRRAQVRALRAHLDASPEVPRVLLGDLNSTPLFPAYRALAAPLADAALLAASRNGGHALPTWSPRPGWPRLLRIDHALVHPILEVGAVRVIDLPGSDHAALLLDITVPAPTA